MNILIFNGCWAPNIGNAFVNIGLEVIMKKCFKDCHIIYSSDVNNKWYFSITNEEHNYANNAFNISAYLKVDLAVWGGMMLTREFIDSAGDVFERLSEKNIPIMFIGAGADKYDKEEFEYVQKYLNKINITGIITRDDETYKMFNECESLTGKIAKGIDCAFFLSDFEVSNLEINPYDVECFDRIPTPYIDHKDKKVITSHHDCYGKLPLRYVKKKDTLISELPYDYLTLYKNVDVTYSERVHACIATLAYGNKAQLYSNTKRASLFTRVLSDDITLDDMKNFPVCLDKEKFELRKNEMIINIMKLLSKEYNQRIESSTFIQEDSPQLLQVYIETISTCNRSCEYCYHSNADVKAKKNIMSEKIFNKIIEDLKERNYSNLIYLYDINEPLLDNRMPKLIKKVATSLPYAKIYIFSNGDLATKEIIQEYFDNGLSHFVFSIHDHSNDNKIKNIIDELGADRFTIADMTILKPDEFNNRGGSITNDEIANQTIFEERKCYLPFRQLAINTDGDIRLCCSIHDEVLFENILNVNIFDYFYKNSKLLSYRSKLNENSRKGLYPCSKCSFIGDNIEGIIQKLGPNYKIRSKALESPGI